MQFISRGIFYLSLIISFLSYADSPPPVQNNPSSEHVFPDPTMNESSIEERAMPSYEGSFAKTMGILVFLLAIVIILFWFIKRFSQTRMHQTNSLRIIKILEKRPISPKSILYLIEVGGKQILIAESQLEIRSISELPWLGNPKEGL